MHCTTLVGQRTNVRLTSLFRGGDISSPPPSNAKGRGTLTYHAVVSSPAIRSGFADSHARITADLRRRRSRAQSVIGTCDVSRNTNLKFALLTDMPSSYHRIMSTQTLSRLSFHFETIPGCKSEKHSGSIFAVDALPVLRRLLVHHSRVRVVQQKHPLHILQLNIGG